MNVYAFVLHCIIVLYYKNKTKILLIYYSIALCEALKTYVDLRRTNTILTD